MKGPLAQLMLLSLLLGLGLWVGVKWFLGRTDDFSSNVDISSVAYVKKEKNSGAKPSSKSDKTASAREVPSMPLEILERNSRIEAQQKSSDEIEKEEDEDASSDAESEEMPADEEADEPAEDPADELLEVVEASDTEVDDDADRSELEKGDSEGARTGTLSEEELQTREKARRTRLAELGIIQEKAPEPTIAVDVSLEMPQRCSGAEIARIPVGLKFRYETAAIRGESLSALESLIAMFRECEDGKFLIAENPLGRADATDALKQMRFDEVKYFFIQHSVSIDTVEFPEE